MFFHNQQRQSYAGELAAWRSFLLAALKQIIKIRALEPQQIQCVLSTLLCDEEAVLQRAGENNSAVCVEIRQLLSARDTVLASLRERDYVCTRGLDFVSEFEQYHAFSQEPLRNWIQSVFAASAPTLFESLEQGRITLFMSLERQVNALHHAVNQGQQHASSIDAHAQSDADESDAASSLSNA